MIVHNEKIVALEGNSFCGKTTLAKQLQEKYGLAVVWEPSQYVDRLPAFPPGTTSEARQAIDTFAEVEKRRTETALALASRDGSIVVYDRGLWTYPAFQYVVMRTMPGVPNAYQYSLDVFERLLQEEEIIAPRALVSLTPLNEAVFLARRAKRGCVGIQFLNDWRTTVTMSRWFAMLINNIYGRQNGLSIACGDNGIEQVATRVNGFLLKSSFSAEAILAFDPLRTLT